MFRMSLLTLTRLVGISPATALSIDSASQVPWKLVEKTKVAYIGELFVEVAASVAAYAKAHAIPVVYRCSVPFWDLGLERLKSILNQADVLLISNQAWNHLNQIMSDGPMQKIREFTDAAIIVKETKSRYKLLMPGKPDAIFSSTERTDELTRWFLVGLLTKIIEDAPIKESVQHAIAFEKSRIG
jgi:sugar/nucleoside kinase (ribokinase family)